MLCVVIDCGSGNLHSASKALERAGIEANYQGDIRITQDAEEVLQASHIVLPGVGAFQKCREGLFALDGMVSALQSRVATQGYPFLGICVGMQLMASLGVEGGGEHKGLNWVDGHVCLLGASENDQDFALKVPHMGWNDIALKQPRHPLFQHIENATDFYFLHSYHFVPDRRESILATTDYGGDVVAAVVRDTMAGVQFHPEKSQESGLQLLRNFLQWKP